MNKLAPINHSRVSAIHNENRTKVYRLITVFRRRKFYFLVPMIVAVLIASLYITFSQKTYRSTVVLKKEQPDNRQPNDPLTQIILSQSQDEVETEMEMMKSMIVSEKVVRDLKLNMVVDAIRIANANPVKVDMALPEFENRYFFHKIDENSYPRFPLLELPADLMPKEYYIIAEDNHVFNLYDGDTRNLLVSSTAFPFADFTVNEMHIRMEWPAAQTGSAIYFTINSPYQTARNLINSIEVGRIGKTNLFKLSVNFSSPLGAKIIADSLVKKFSEVRLRQKRQTFKYSFKFIDQQLQEIQTKLKFAERNLSQFKRRYRIVDMQENSKELINFLGDLQTEQIKTELQKKQYQDKRAQLVKDFKDNGYFDQTYLTPGDPEQSSTLTPFSALLQKLSDAEIKRLQLLEKRTERHPDVVAVNKEIANIKEQLASYNQNTLSAYNVIINNLDNKDTELQNLIGKYSGRMESLPAKEAELAQLVRKKDVYEKIFQLLLDKREEVRMAEVSKLQDVSVTDPAHIPLKPVWPRSKLILLVSLILGFSMGLTLVLFREYFEDKFVDLRDIEDESPVPVLSVIPKYSKNLVRKLNQSINMNERFLSFMTEQPGSLESYRVLRTKVLKNFQNKSMLITSCEEQTGKTTIAANLAVCLYLIHKKVLVIDGDLRRGRLGDLFNIPNNHATLADFLSGKIELIDHSKLVLNKNKSIHVLPSGGPIENSSELLTSPKMKELLDYADSYFDYILVDTPPVTRIADTLVLGDYIKDVLLIVRPDHTYMEDVSLAVQELEQVDAKVLGVVVNGSSDNNTYYHSSRYKYGYSYSEENHHEKSGF